mgnify:CR=1 FL=1
MKILSGLLVAIVFVVVVAGFYIANNMNGLVKGAVEDVGSQILKTSVTMDEVNIQLLQGKARLSGLKIANLQGFSQPYIFLLDNIVVDLDIASLMEQRVSLNEVTIDGASVIAEQKGLGTNLQALLKNVEGSSGAGGETTESGDSAGADIAIKIGLFQFLNSSTVLVSEKWGQKDVSIPDVQLKNLGGEKGLPPQELAQAILKPVLKQLNKAIETRLKELFEGKAKEMLEEKEDELKKKLNDKLSDKLGGDSGAKIDSLKSLLSR